MTIAKQTEGWIRRIGKSIVDYANKTKSGYFYIWDVPEIDIFENQWYSFEPIIRVFNGEVRIQLVGLLPKWGGVSVELGLKPITTIYTTTKFNFEVKAASEN